MFTNRNVRRNNKLFKPYYAYHFVVETVSATIKLIFKLMGVIGIIWGLGWIIYENTFLCSHFTATNYQNILLVIMSATWLILLAGVYGKEPQTHRLSPIKLCEETSKRATTKRKSRASNKTKINIEALIKKALEKQSVLQESS